MPNKHLIPLSTALLALTLAGCGQTPAALSSGTYAAAPGEAVLPPSLTLDMTELRFTFTHDLLSSYLSVGSFVLADDKLTASTDDGRYTYVFSVTGADTLTFVPEESSLLSTSGHILTQDQTTFRLKEE